MTELFARLAPGASIDAARAELTSVFAGMTRQHLDAYPVKANTQLPGALPLAGASAVLMGAAMVASLMPAARASRVNVLQALRSE